MFLIFLHEESYLKFLVEYLETKKMNPDEEEEDDEESKTEDGTGGTRSQKSYTITFQKNTKVTESDTQKVSKFLHIKELGKELKERTESMNLRKMKEKKGSPAQKNSRTSIIVENELKNLIISSFTDNIRDSGSPVNSPLNSGNNTPSNRQKFIEKELTKEEIAKYERNYFILAQGGMFSGVFSKNEKIIKFCCENLELQFCNTANRKFICSFILADLGSIGKDNDKQITLSFKNSRKMKNLSMKFPNSDDLQEFIETYQILSKRKKKSKPNDVEFKDFLKKNLRRYSWLNQPLNALLPKKTSAEYSFQIINEKFSPARQLLHINFIHKIVSFLKKEKEKAVILKEFNIQKIMHLENCFQDPSKLTLKLDKKKSISIMFSNVQNKLVFESATNAILVFPFLIKKLISVCRMKP